MISRYRRVWNK